MAQLKITALADEALTDSKYVYKDLHLDLSMGYSQSNQLAKKGEILDAKADVDLQAVYNSINNIFNTSFGERILNPTFGLNLKQYLFEPVNKQTGSLIGDAIKTGIATYEPRVDIQTINIIVDEDQQQYQISIVIKVPELANRIVTIPGVLSNSGFKYIL